MRNRTYVYLWTDVMIEQRNHTLIKELERHHLGFLRTSALGIRDSHAIKLRPSIKPGTWNIPEHPGTSNNYDNYEKKMCKRKFWACSRDHLKRSDWSRRPPNMFLFASRTTLLRNESYGRTSHRGKSVEKVYEVTDYWWYFEWRRECSTEYYPGSFRAIGSKYKVNVVTSFKRMEDLLSNGSGKSPSPCCS